MNFLECENKRNFHVKSCDRPVLINCILDNRMENESSFDYEPEYYVKKCVKPKTEMISLHDACCAKIAQSMAFEGVLQTSYQLNGCPLPEHSQMKIAFYSFPSSTAEIEVYSRLGNIDVLAARNLSDQGPLKQGVFQFFFIYNF